MPIDLSEREWPERVPGVGMSLLHEGYVTEGQMIAMSLGFPGMCLPIPADEAYVTALAVDERRVVYGGTGGRRAHLFVAMTHGLTGAVVDLCTLEENARVSSVLVAQDGRVLATTAPGAPGPTLPRPGAQPEGEGALYVHDHVGLPYDLVHEWQFIKSPAEKVCTPLPDEGIGCAVMGVDDCGEEAIIGIGDRSGSLFTHTIESGRTEVHGPVDEKGLFSRAIVRGPDGAVYGTGALGRLWRYDPLFEGMQETGVDIPTVAGRAVRNQADSFAVDADRGLIYGGGTADGVLFCYDVAERTIRSLGKPTCYRGIKGMAVTNDGRLFGISGREGDIGHLFCYDPDRHELRDLGMIASVIQERVYGYEFACSAVGRDGQIYFGERDRGGHLWTYWPAVRHPAPAED
jgi:hypothetical protein